MRNLILLFVLCFNLSLYTQTQLDTLIYNEINKYRVDVVELTDKYYDDVLNHNKSTYVYSKIRGGLPIVSHNEYIKNDTIQLNTFKNRYNNGLGGWGEIMLCEPYETVVAENNTEKIERIVNKFIKSEKHKKILMNKKYTNICVSSYIFKCEITNIKFIYVTIVFY